MSIGSDQDNVRATVTSIAAWVDKMDWGHVESDLDELGWSLQKHFINSKECSALTAFFSQDDRFRRRVVMEQHGYGQGEYKYFSYPLPNIVADLRDTLYSRLVPVANRWNAQMSTKVRYPYNHSAFLKRCHKAGQTRPTPLMLRYRKGDFNCLHQDLYGEHIFPIQATILLSAPGEDFTGGEFVPTEQKPRMQSRPQIVPLCKGDVVFFATHNRPRQGKRGYHRVIMRHGVSTLHSGDRHTLGIIFHDAA